MRLVIGDVVNIVMSCLFAKERGSKIEPNQSKTIITTQNLQKRSG